MFAPHGGAGCSTATSAESRYCSLLLLLLLLLVVVLVLGAAVSLLLSSSSPLLGRELCSSIWADITTSVESPDPASIKPAHAD